MTRLLIDSYVYTFCLLLGHQVHIAAAQNCRYSTYECEDRISPLSARCLNLLIFGMAASVKLYKINVMLSLAEWETNLINSFIPRWGQLFSATRVAISSSFLFSMARNLSRRNSFVFLVRRAERSEAKTRENNGIE